MDSLVPEAARTVLRRFVFAAVAFGTVVALAACGSDSGADDDGSANSTETTQPTTATAPPSTAASTLPADPLSRVRAATKAPPEQYHDGIYWGVDPEPVSYDEVAFDSPTHNITCHWGASDSESRHNVRCRIDERKDLPPEEADCEFDWDPNLFGVYSGGVWNGDCVSDVSVPNSANVLPYGSGLLFDKYGCLSEQTGVTCVELTTGRGFTVSKAKFVEF